MKKTDLLVIGGSAGGILAAQMARKAYGDIDITLIRDTETVMVPCGIPYIFGTLRDIKKNIIPDKMLEIANVNLIIDSAEAIDRKNKLVSTKDNGDINYKKLIIATGSLPIIPTFIPGYDLENVFPILKGEDYLSRIFDKLDRAKNIVVIGGGFIGVEFAEQVRMLDKNVTLVEMADACLWQAFDKEYTDDIEDIYHEKASIDEIEKFINKVVREELVDIMYRYIRLHRKDMKEILGDFIADDDGYLDWDDEEDE